MGGKRWNGYNRKIERAPSFQKNASKETGKCERKIQQKRKQQGVKRVSRQQRQEKVNLGCAEVVGGRGVM